LADTEASGTATLSVSEDEGGTWTSKGTFDMTAQKKRIHRLGMHKGPRSYRIQHSANTGFRAQLLRINFQPGSY
jgi:hypothetical protein